MVMAVLLTFVAGVLGTLLGGVLGLRIDPKSSKSLSCLLAFSAGMMISMICFDLMPEALEHAGSGNRGRRLRIGRAASIKI